jgi:hypothetical protein
MLVLSTIMENNKTKTMKKYILSAVVSVFVFAVFNSCKQDTSHVIVNSNLYQAYLKVIHASPGFAKVFNAPDNFNVIVGGINGQRLAAAFTYGSAFPANTFNLDTYASVPSGSQDIRLVLKGVVNIDSITVATIPQNLVPGNYYTLIITDSITTTPNYSKIFTQDIFAVPVTGTYFLRFIDAVMNDTAGKKVDVYSFRAKANIFTSVSPGGITNFNSIAYNSIPDSFSIRRSGSTFELARVNTVSFTNNQRVYTLLYRGDGTLTSGTKARGGLVYNNW